MSTIQLESRPLAVIEHARLERAERRRLVASRAVLATLDLERLVIELALMRVVVASEAALEGSEVFFDEAKAASEFVGRRAARMTALAALALKVSAVDLEECPEPVIEAVVRFSS